MRQPEMRQPEMRQPEMRQSDMRQPDMMQYDMRQPEMMQYDMRRSKTIPNRYENMSNKKNNYESFQDNGGFSYTSLIKRIIVYTILFLIMSHLKMNNILCHFIPFLENNEIACMAMKGFIMSCIIIIVYPLL